MLGSHGAAAGVSSMAAAVTAVTGVAFALEHTTRPTATQAWVTTQTERAPPAMTQAEGTALTATTTPPGTQPRVREMGPTIATTPTGSRHGGAWEH